MVVTVITDRWKEKGGEKTYRERVFNVWQKRRDGCRLVASKPINMTEQCNAATSPPRLRRPPAQVEPPRAAPAPVRVQPEQRYGPVPGPQAGRQDAGAAAVRALRKSALPPVLT